MRRSVSVGGRSAGIALGALVLAIIPVVGMAIVQQSSLVHGAAPTTRILPHTNTQIPLGVSAKDRSNKLSGTETHIQDRNGIDPTAPQAVDAHMYLTPSVSAGNCPAPSNGGAVGLNCRFVLDLWIDLGTNTDGAAQQSYLTFTHQLLQNARVANIASGCVVTSTVTQDSGDPDNQIGFDVTLQNEVCNGPDQCDFRGRIVEPGSIAFASGTLSYPLQGGEFRVARIGICTGSTSGLATLHWQFAPPQTCENGAPSSRDTEIASEDGSLIQNCTLFTDYTFCVGGSCGALTATPTITATNTPTEIPTNTPTETPSNTHTDTPTNTATDTPEPIITTTPTQTRTSTETLLPTNTATDTQTPTSTYTATATDTSTPTYTPVLTSTSSPTNTASATSTPLPPTNTFVSTNTATLTHSPTRTPTSTATNTRTNSPTNTRTNTFTATNTNTAVPTITRTNTPVPTNTRTGTATFTSTPCAANANYQVVTASATLVPGTLDIGNHCDECNTLITLPFTFNLYGQPFTSARAASNGTLQFGSDSIDYNNTCLPRGAFSDTIFAYWDDLYTGGTAFGQGIFTSVSGSAPNRVFNIEWRVRYCCSDNVVTNNFEIRLYEGASGRFEIVYALVEAGGGPHGNDQGVTVGVQRDSGSLFTQYSCNQVALSNGLMLVFQRPVCATATPTSTPSSTVSATRTSSATATSTSTSVPTHTLVATNTITRTSTPSHTTTPLNSPTITSTSTPISGPALVGHVIWQGRPAQPSALQQVPVTLTLKIGTTEINYPVQSTDARGMFTVSVAGLADGTYSWRAKARKYLANSGTVTLTGAEITNVEMGLMRAGDADNDNVVGITDFNILKGTFGKVVGQQGYDDRADFTGDMTVSIADFNLQKQTFGQQGAPPIRPQEGGDGSP